MADLDLARRVLRADPVGADGAVEIEVGGEDADLLDLALEREGEGAVRRRSDVGGVDVEDRGREGVERDGTEDREDEEDDANRECAEGEDWAEDEELSTARSASVLGSRPHRILTFFDL